MPSFDTRSAGLLAVCALALSPAAFAQTEPIVPAPAAALAEAPALPPPSPLPLFASAATPALNPDTTPDTTAPSALPDAPDAPQASSSSADPAAHDPQTGQPTAPKNSPQSDNPDALSANGTHQTKRIVGIIPNFRSVSADQTLPPQTVGEKFANAARDSFDYGSFILAAVQAGFAQNSDSYPEFHQGVKGYGQYFWHTLVDTADENFMVGGVFPSVFHQDPRFYTLGHGTFLHRALYASTRVLITRGDSGNAQPNFSEIIGAGAASGLSSTYYPAVYRTWTKVGQKWLTGVLIDSANYTFKEFWPDINKKFIHEKD